MKQGKAPTKKQSEFISENGFDARKYLIERDTSEIMVIVDRETLEKINLPK